VGGTERLWGGAGRGVGAAAIRPDAGDRPKKGRFAGPRRAGQYHWLARVKPHARAFDDLPPVRQAQIERLDIEMFARGLSIRALLGRKGRLSCVRGRPPEPGPTGE